MNGWLELKDAFWAAVEGGPEERDRQMARLSVIDPAMADRLAALLAADGLADSQGVLLLAAPEAVLPEDIAGYEVVGRLGSGGMGDVYRAHDKRLNRDVAIKVLPANVADDPRRLARFAREAQLLAALNHPHIAQVYGLEDSGGVRAIVMELVEGPTLTSVIADSRERAISTKRILTIARQIADGLDAAHQKGIIHRDLKPGNVVLTSSGVVKILDFGIATSTTDANHDAASSARVTETGTIVGTRAYMSPEQARGLAVDKRTDIWSFGCLLYELLTARSAFAYSQSEVVAESGDIGPDLERLPSDTPRAVRALIRHCLETNPARRLRDIGDARLMLDESLEPTAETMAARVPGGVRPLMRLLLTTAGLGGIVAAIGLAIVAARPDRSESLRVVSSIQLPRGMRLSGADIEARGSESRFAVAPDGRRLVLVAADQSGQTRLWIRDLASAVLQPLPESEGGRFRSGPQTPSP